MTDAFSLAAQLVTGWLVADFLSGIIHWIDDRLLWVGMPLIRKSVVEPHRLLPRDHDAFLAQSIVARTSTAWAAVASIALPWPCISSFSWVWFGSPPGGCRVMLGGASGRTESVRSSKVLGAQ